VTRVLLVGCGKMGGALLSGWLERGVSPADVVVVEPGGGAAEFAAKGVAVVADAAAIPGGFVPEVAVLAVKPQVMAEVLPPYRRFADTTTFLSIAAGKPIAFFEGLLGEAAVVRAMPNTPAAVRRGITVAICNGMVGASARMACDSLLQAVGEVAWSDDESLMDAVTAVSGSGPAYVFLLTECLAKAGIAAGLSPDLADKLARATVTGSGELLHQSAETAETLRRNVTSPGGTTAAALAVLMADKDGLQSLMTAAVAAAAKRGKELAG
jgi:pyrroline-5-carboxylate reductase